jgi:hypothetical protein
MVIGGDRRFFSSIVRMSAGTLGLADGDSLKLRLGLSLTLGLGDSETDSDMLGEGLSLTLGDGLKLADPPP